MSVAFRRGTTTGPNDLAITMRDTVGNLMDPYRLQYAVYDRTTGLEVLIGSPVNTPIRLSLGQYYAQVSLPADCNIGDWLIRWTIQETSTDPVYQSVQEFNAVGDSTIVSFTGDQNLDGLIFSLRIFLRDNNPDRNYRARPPESAKFIQGQTQVFGFIWEDEELLEYLEWAVDDFNSRPPVTGITVGDLWSSMKRWKTAILLRAASFACFAIAMNWVADEFSIGGEEELIVRIGAEGPDIKMTIGILFMLLYGDAIAQGQNDARQGIAEATGEGYKPVIAGKYSMNDLQSAYKSGNLFTQSMNATGYVVWSPISQVVRHECPQKRIYRISTKLGDTIVTEDHSLFLFNDKAPTQVRDLMVGDTIVAHDGRLVTMTPITDIEELPSRQYMFDLSVPGTENFFLASGILAHNTYSISGVSLDVEKSSKYQSMKDEFIAEWDKAVEAAKRSIKIIKGLRQYRYGIGISSALGPINRPGVQSRRNMVTPGAAGSWA